MAGSLIDSMTVDFDPSQYRDGYREALEELVAAKIQGRDVIRPQESAGGPGSGSLADVLEASLAAAREGQAQQDDETGDPAHSGRKRRPERQASA